MSSFKGIILAGGTGTRLYPVTKSISKQLLPVYDKPMVYYPLSVLMLSGIRDILIISTEEDISLYEKLLDEGSHLGMSFSYTVQEKPRGIAESFILAEDFIQNSKVSLILGDNIFYGQGLSSILKQATELEQGALIYGYYVKDPQSFGVVEIDLETNKAISLEEKPQFPKSKFAVPGLYFYDEKVVELAKKLKPSARGELEITALNNEYLKLGQLNVKIFGRGLAWFDTGTHEGLLEASNFVAAIQKRQGFFISCIEEIAYRLGYITKSQLLVLAKEQSKSDYGKYLESIAQLNL